MSTLLSQLDRALLATELDKAPTSSALLLELHRTTGGSQKICPPEILRDGRVIPITPRGLAPSACGGPLSLGMEVASPKELATLRQIEDKMKALLKQAEQFSLVNVSGAL